MYSPTDLNLITAEKIAAMLDCSKSTVWRWVKEGRFPPPIKIGSVSRWPVRDVYRLIGASHSFGPWDVFGRTVDVAVSSGTAGLGCEAVHSDDWKGSPGKSILKASKHSCLIRGCQVRQGRKKLVSTDTMTGRVGS